MAWQIVDRLKGTPDSADKVVTDEMRQKIEAEFAKYPTKQAVLLTSLHMVQNKYKQISDQAIRELAEIHEISPGEVLDTLSFYDMYSREKLGKNLIGVCVSLSCDICGCKDLMKKVKDKLNIGPRETTEDGKFTLIPMECIGACEMAPAILMNEDLHKIESVEQLDDLIDKTA